MLSASDCSAHALASVLSGTEQGQFYPMGGYEAVVKALVRAIRRAGGEVYR